MQQKAFSVFLTIIIILALAMFAYYRFVLSHSKDEVSLNDRIESTIEKTEEEGSFSPLDPVVWNQFRMAFFTIAKDQAGNWKASLRLDQTNSDMKEFIECQDIKVQNKEYFLKCSKDERNFSISGLLVHGAEGNILDGKILWAESGSIVLEKKLNFSQNPILQ